MRRLHISVTIDNNLKNIGIKRGWLKTLTSNVFKYIKIQHPVEMGVRLTDNSCIRELNRRYRGRNTATDVLSFNMVDPAGEGEFIDAPDRIKHIGEIVISWDKSAEQAKLFGIGIKKEIAILTIHGILHLLGYDHENENDHIIMHTEETHILENVELEMDLD